MNKKIFALQTTSADGVPAVRVYQAYAPVIAEEAVALGHFGPHFKMERMTWIKPSFLWMMYRSGWASKAGQERVLAIDITAAGFREILQGAVLTSYHEGTYGTREHWKEKLRCSEVRCQWDPDKDIHMNPLERRAIQLGLSGKTVWQYVNEWTQCITDITDTVHEMKRLIDCGKAGQVLLPEETEFPLTEEEEKILGMVPAFQKKEPCELTGQGHG